MYCYVCLTYIVRGGTVSYSYRNALAQTVTGTVTVLTGLASLLAILGVSTNTLITFNSADNQPFGIIEQTAVHGTSLCLYHAVSGIIMR